MADEAPGLIEFMETYPTEDACWQFLREARWGPDGFECPRCGENEHWGFIQTRKLFACHQCGKQTSVTAGTILQDRKLPLKKYLLAVYLVVTTKKSITTTELARKLECHQSNAYYIFQKVTHILAQDQARELFGVTEVDETYVGGKRPDDKPGRGTSKPTVLGAVETLDEGAGLLRLEHVPNAGKDTLQKRVEAWIEPGATLVTDGWDSYLGMEAYGHEQIKQTDRSTAGEDLPWIHTVFTNLKRVLYGVHSYVSDFKVQAYLDLFTFRFNHRFWPKWGLEKALNGLVTTGPCPTRQFMGCVPSRCAA